MFGKCSGSGTLAVTAGLIYMQYCSCKTQVACLYRTRRSPYALKEGQSLARIMETLTVAVEFINLPTLGNQLPALEELRKDTLRSAARFIHVECSSTCSLPQVSAILRAFSKDCLCNVNAGRTRTCGTRSPSGSASQGA